MNNIDNLFSDISPGEAKFVIDWHIRRKTFTGMKFGYEIGRMRRKGFKNTFKITRRARKYGQLSDEEWMEVKEKYYPKDE